MKPRRGAYVTEVEHQDLEQIFAVIAELEGFAVKEVAIKATEAQLNQLDNLHLKLEKAAADRDVERFFEINVQFHELIMEIAGNRWMNDVIADLRKVLKLQRRDSLSRAGRLQNALNEHRNILNALIKRDGDAAKLAMQAHLARGLEATR
jgi:DNA-binding GntR family transcriptional regulator